MGRPIKVLVIDDSALVRRLLTEILGSDSGLEVVGTAVDPLDARQKIKQLNPDVLTLDVEMPNMDGITFLRNLMRLRPTPTLMVSSLTEHGAEITLEALALGAFDFVTKPRVGVKEGLLEYADTIIGKVKAAAAAGVRNRPSQAGATAVNPASKVTPTVLRTTDKLIAIAASTGGTEAIIEVLSALPPDAPGIVIAQHIPAVFSARFAARIDRVTALHCAEAVDGQQIVVGHVYVAPGNFHLRVERSGARYRCRVTQDDAVNRHRPSCDVLLESVARSAGPNATGVILTGMGADGAEGLGALKRAGGHTIAQDKDTSVVWGMPGEAVKRGFATAVLPLGSIAGQLIKHQQQTH